MEDGFIDDYPLLDFELSDDFGASSVYAEGDIAWGQDGPELAVPEAPWADDDCDDYEDEFAYQMPKNDADEEFYVLSPSELSCCYEEWEDYC